MKKKPYSACSDTEREQVDMQIRVIAERAERNYIHMLVPNQSLLGIRLSDMTPIHVSIEDFARIVVERGFITQPFIVAHGTTGYGDYILQFVLGLTAARVPEPVFPGIVELNIE